MKAMKKDNNDITKLLLEQKGIDVDVKDKEGKTALDKIGLNDKNDIIKMFRTTANKPESPDERESLGSNGIKNYFVPGHCSFEQTGYKNVRPTVQYYRCQTCMNNYGIDYMFCEQCAKVCHKGHIVLPTGSNHGFCDCGAGHFLFPCKLMQKHNSENNK